MKNKNRKEDLKQLALKKMDNGGRIYQLINSNKLDKIIDLMAEDIIKYAISKSEKSSKTRIA